MPFPTSSRPTIAPSPIFCPKDSATDSRGEDQHGGSRLHGALLIQRAQLLLTSVSLTTPRERSMRAMAGCSSQSAFTLNSLRPHRRLPRRPPLLPLALLEGVHQRLLSGQRGLPRGIVGIFHP